MNAALYNALKVQCRKSIKAANLSSYLKWKNRRDYHKATGEAVPPVSGRLKIWGLSSQFNPHRISRKLDFYASRLEKSIAAGTYSPKPCLNVEIPKDGGRKRIISQYSVTDSAVSCWLYSELLHKNLSKLSKYAYAFRRDKNGTMAVAMLAKALKTSQRVFSVEIDFKNCFDEVNHAHLLEVLNRRFNVTPSELKLVKAFLKGSYARGFDQYQKGNFKPRLTGIPQGTTLSLFLANAVFADLDENLESLGVVFARYADDILVLAESYDLANKAARVIAEFSVQSKIPINDKKSAGITLISRSNGEIKSKQRIEYLGYSFSQDDIRLSAKRKSAVKKTLSEIVNRRLLIHPRLGDLSRKRFYGGTDWDLVVCINDLRRRIYGRSVSEDEVTAPIQRGTRSPRSIVSGHVLVNGNADYLELDGWLLGCLRRALIQRAALVAKMKVTGSIKPNRKELLDGSWYTNKAIPQDMRLPGLTKAWKYARQVLLVSGAAAFEEDYYE